MLRDIPRLLVFWKPQLKVRKWDRCEKKWKSMFWNEVFIIHYSLPKSVEKMLMANFCRHQAYLRWQIRQQLLFAVANFEGCFKIHFLNFTMPQLVLLFVFGGFVPIIILSNSFSLGSNLDYYHQYQHSHQSQSVLLPICFSVKFLSYEIVFVYNLLLGFRSSHRRCSVRKGVLRNFAKFLRTPFLQNISGRLLMLDSNYHVLFKFEIGKWRHCNALQGENINPFMACWKWYSSPPDL